jgi:hypothetical protein
MSQIMDRLKIITDFETKLIEYDEKMRVARSKQDTTLAELGTLMKEADETANQFNKWMTEEFGFKPGPMIMPTILKTVLEKCFEPSRIITP